MTHQNMFLMTFSKDLDLKLFDTSSHPYELLDIVAYDYKLNYMYWSLHDQEKSTRIYREYTSWIGNDWPH